MNFDSIPIPKLDENENNIEEANNHDVTNNNDRNMEDCENYIPSPPLLTPPLKAQDPAITTHSTPDQPKHNSKLKLKHTRTLFLQINTKQYLSSQQNHNVHATLNVVYSYDPNAFSLSAQTSYDSTDTSPEESMVAANSGGKTNNSSTMESMNSGEIHVCSVPVKASRALNYRRRREVYEHELPCAAVTFNSQQCMQLLQSNNFHPLRSKSTSLNSSPSHQSSRAFPVDAPNPEFSLVSIPQSTADNASLNNSILSLKSFQLNSPQQIDSRSSSFSFSTTAQSRLSSLFSEVPVKLLPPDYVEDHCLLQPASVAEINELKLFNGGLEIMNENNSGENSGRCSAEPVLQDEFMKLEADNDLVTVTNTSSNSNNNIQLTAPAYLVHVTAKSRTKAPKKLSKNSSSSSNIASITHINTGEEDDMSNPSSRSISANSTSSILLHSPVSMSASPSRNISSQVAAINERKRHWMVMQQEQIYKLTLVSYIDPEEFNANNPNVTQELASARLNVRVFYGAYRSLDEQCPGTFKPSLRTQTEQQLVDENSPISCLLMPTQIASEIQSIIHSFAVMNVFSIEECAQLYLLTHTNHTDEIQAINNLKAHFNQNQLIVMQRAYAAKQFLLQRKYDFSHQAQLRILNCNIPDSFEKVEWQPGMHNHYCYVDLSAERSDSRSSTPYAYGSMLQTNNSNNTASNHRASPSRQQQQQRFDVPVVTHLKSPTRPRRSVSFSANVSPVANLPFLAPVVNNSHPQTNPTTNRNTPTPQTIVQSRSLNSSPIGGGSSFSYPNTNTSPHLTSIIEKPSNFAVPRKLFTNLNNNSSNTATMPKNYNDRTVNLNFIFNHLAEHAQPQSNTNNQNISNTNNSNNNPVDLIVNPPVLTNYSAPLVNAMAVAAGQQEQNQRVSLAIDQYNRLQQVNEILSVLNLRRAQSTPTQHFDELSLNDNSNNNTAMNANTNNSGTSMLDIQQQQQQNIDDPANLLFDHLKQQIALNNSNVVNAMPKNLSNNNSNTNNYLMNLMLNNQSGSSASRNPLVSPSLLFQPSPNSAFVSSTSISTTTASHSTPASRSNNPSPSRLQNQSTKRKLTDPISILSAGNSTTTNLNDAAANVDWSALLLKTATASQNIQANNSNTSIRNSNELTEAELSLLLQAQLEHALNNSKNQRQRVEYGVPVVAQQQQNNPLFVPVFDWSSNNASMFSTTSNNPNASSTAATPSILHHNLHNPNSGS